MWQHHVEILCEIRERELREEISVIVRERAMHRSLRSNEAATAVRLGAPARRAAVALGRALVSLGRRFEAFGASSVGRVSMPPDPGS
jgi:hypothetical protein